MKAHFILILSILSISLFAQQTTFDLINYAELKGWKKEVKANSNVKYTKTDNKTGGWCQIAIYHSLPTKGNIDEDFSSEWAELVVKSFTNAQGPRGDSVIQVNDWKMKTGAGSFTFNNSNCLVLLTTFNGYNTCSSIMASTNKQEYMNEVYNFMKGVTLNRPATNSTTNVATTNTVQPTTALSDGYKFNTSNFDDGWTSTVQPDWVEVTKGDTKVLIHFLSSISDNYESNIMMTNKVAWDHFIVPRYSSLTNYEYLKGNMSYIPVYMMAGNLIDKSGKSVFVVLFRNGGREQNWMEFIFPNRQRFTQVFGIDKYDGYTKWDALGKMINYNKFAVALSDLKGTWTNSFSGMTQYVYANTGLNAGATSNSSAQEYVIDAAGNYSWNINVASGVVGNLKFQNAKSAGKLTMTNNWQIHLSNIENKPRDYTVYFSCIKGARVLNIDGQVFVRK